MAFSLPLQWWQLVRSRFKARSYFSWLLVSCLLLYNLPSNQFSFRLTCLIISPSSWTMTPSMVDGTLKKKFYHLLNFNALFFVSLFGWLSWVLRIWKSLYIYFIFYFARVSWPTHIYRYIFTTVNYIIGATPRIKKKTQFWWFRILSTISNDFDIIRNDVHVVILSIDSSKLCKHVLRSNIIFFC